MFGVRLKSDKAGGGWILMRATQDVEYTGVYVFYLNTYK